LSTDKATICKPRECCDSQSFSMLGLCMAQNGHVLDHQYTSSG